MTTKQIAEATGKAERTIRTWISISSAEMAVVAAKMSDSTPAHPADFTIDEVLGIIEAGAGKEAAGIFRANAGKTNESADGNGLAHLGAMVANLAVMMQETMKVMVTQQNQITAILSQPNQPNQPKQLAYTQDYFGVIAFANTKGLKPTITEAQQLGRMARAVSAAKGLEIRTMPDERWGKVNSYHVDVLKEVFAS